MRLHHRLALALAVVVVTAGSVVVGPAATAQAAAPSTGRYTPLDATRVWSGAVSTTSTVVPVAGHAGVPSKATAVVLNVTVTKPSVAGNVRVTARGVAARVPTQQFRAGQTIANAATVRLVQGAVQVQLSAGRATVAVDVSGYYADGTGTTFTPVDAAHVFQQRVGTTAVRVPLAGRAGIPANATAVAVTAGVGSPTADGAVRVTAAGRAARVDTQAFTKGTAVSNTTVVPLAGGAAQVQVSRGAATVSLDVSGYYAATATGSTFVPMDVVRAARGTVTTTARTVRLTGTAGVPGTATAVVANATVEQPTAAGSLRVTSAAEDAAVTSQTFGAKQPVSGLVVTKVTGSTVDRRVQARVSRGTAVLDLDVAGYFVDGSSGSGFGADVSWPQGTSSANYPRNQAFGIVGVTGGLANTTNPGLAQQLAWAAGSAGGTSQPKVQLYVNTANPGRYFAEHPTTSRASWPTSNTDVSGAAAPNPYGRCVTGAAALRSASCSWMYGWNRALEDAQRRGVTSPGSYRWWLDAETDGSWQGNPALDRATLEGMTAYFTRIGGSVGVYSSPSEWSTLFGAVPATSPLYRLPTWRAIGPATAATAQAACSAAPFTAGGRTTMVQYVSGRFDAVVSCV